MPHLPTETDPTLWHKYFAMETNNRAWALSVCSRSAAEDEEMLTAAHTSVYHWQEIGIELNTMRAKMLLCEVHALMGLGTSAVKLASEMREFFLEIETPDWELAFVHTIYAHAAYAAGDLEQYKLAYYDAELALGVIADDEDRKVVQKTFDLVPKPSTSIAPG